tara:strand:- start:1688 stop:1909 length:222 start_codon:yes stop_codon:yes gene_type:complete
MHACILAKKKLFNTKLRYNILMKIYLVWLIGVIAWNYGVPKAAPIEDVIVAILLSFFSIGIKKLLNSRYSAEK